MNQKISPAEWEVLNVIWDRGEPVTATDVYEALAKDRKRHPKTVNTFIARLVDKEILRARRDGKANVYTAAVTREQCVRQESESFLRRVFRGATGPLLAHFCERADLSDEEIAQLKKLLEQRTKKGRKK
jgi:BlaI family transcriptional regulator, penicillinase repressor